MPVRKKKVAEIPLREIITDALLDKQGKDIVILDFKKIGSSICDAFIICHGASRPQVEALTESVLENVKKKTGQNALHKEGFENAEWILIDYGDILVHIFQDSTRIFYNLEQLWADAEITKIKSTD
ncbi:MAG TPA: ribosome silencing factor [Bacteroidales bacterium]|nr:ribosome silencing factor [Bacteroidales bacterium]